MTEVLYFPKLGLTFNLSKIAFSVGPIKVYWYGILITLGFMLAIGYVTLISKKFQIKLDDVFDIIIYSVFGAIVGARAYYVVFNFRLYKDNFLDVFKIWEGGIAIYGAIIGAFLVAIVMLKKRKMDVLPSLDMAVGGLLLGQAVGRWGNFVNMEAFGRNTDMFLGMTSRSIQRYLFEVAPVLAKQGVYVDSAKSVHPCFLYESVWCLLGFIIINFVIFKFNYKRDYKNFNGKIDVDDGLTNKRENLNGNLCCHVCECGVNQNNETKGNDRKINIYPGELLLIYFIWYGTGRFFIEGLRVDSLMMCGVKISQLLSLVFVAFSILFFVILRLIRSQKIGRKCHKGRKVFVDISSPEEILKKYKI